MPDSPSQKNKAKNRPSSIFIGLSLYLFSSLTYATLLTDPQLYFEPTSIQPGFYQRIYLYDLTIDNNYTFTADDDPIIDADILPPLKSNVYPSNHEFTQADYINTPNKDYYADLSAVGNLKTTFTESGLYHVRVTRQSGANNIYAIFSEASLEEKDGAPNRTGANGQIAIPNADLYIIDNGNPDEAKERETILKNSRQTTELVNDRNQAVKAIETRSTQLGRKIHVEIAGHGASGNASTGAGKLNVADKQIDSTTVANFQKLVDKYVDNITFYLMCSVGEGDNGKAFLKVLADSIGQAGAWDSTVYRVDSKYYTVGLEAKSVIEGKTPEPSSISLIILSLSYLVLSKHKGT